MGKMSGKHSAGGCANRKARGKRAAVIVNGGVSRADGPVCLFRQAQGTERSRRATEENFDLVTERTEIEPEFTEDLSYSVTSVWASVLSVSKILVSKSI